MPTRPLGTVKYGLWNRGRVSPLRPGRKLAALVVFTILFGGVLGSVALAQAQGNTTNSTGSGSGGDAAAPAGKGIHRVITIGVIPCPGDPNSFCWDTPRVPALPGDQITLTADFTGQSAPHNLHVTGLDQDLKTPNSFGQPVSLNFTFPEGKKEINFNCDLHPKTMAGKIVLASELTTGEAPAVPELGVHFLSYWVGMIAFMLLFLVYGLTFFLFKYNETPAATDHWDRTGGEGLTERPGMRGGRASLIALVLAIVIIAAVVGAARYLASR
ncbi:MAG: hypothetical protein QOE90_630 [Thermoplasmata archaeon]|jgi:hypothetical protein|nr:hypothetical protein [Thermoplasmata archaeon]